MLKLDIQMFANPKLVVEAKLDSKEFENGLDKMKSTSQSAGNSIKSIVAGLGITKLIGVAMNQINSSLDSAITRLDTLNNFPKVMNSLGISSEDAEKSINKMSEKLSGLPTTLDQGANAVKRFTAYNGDVKKSTDMFLAVNNAILAGGASMELQSSALEQLTQAYTKGKPEAQDWKTIMQAMPAQLKQVANTMGYTSTAIGGDFYEALMEGNITMEDFMDTVIELNEKGGEGFKSFSEQAKTGTEGIATSITVAKTQITKGIADIIQGLNKGLEEADLPNLTEIIQNIGKGAKKVLDVIADKLPEIINFLKTIAPILAPILAAVMAFKVLGTIISLINAAKTAMIALNVVLAANPIGLVVAAIVGLVAAFAILWNKSEAFRNFWIGIWEGIKNIVKAAIDIVVNKIRDFAAKIIAIFNIGKAIFDIGKNIVVGLWNGISSSLSWIKNKISGWVGSVMKHFKKLFGVASPSKRMRDEVGVFLAQGLGVGFDEELDSVYKDMQRAIDIEQEKLQASVETGSVFNTLQNSTPVAISVNADVEMDSQKVGRLVTPTVTRTIKNGGGV